MLAAIEHHDLVKAVLRADRLRHHLAKPAQQYARTAQRAAHGVRSLGLMSEPGSPVTRLSEVIALWPEPRRTHLGYSEWYRRAARRNAMLRCAKI